MKDTCLFVFSSFTVNLLLKIIFSLFILDTFLNGEGLYCQVQHIDIGMILISVEHTDQIFFVIEYMDGHEFSAWYFRVKDNVVVSHPHWLSIHINI